MKDVARLGRSVCECCRYDFGTAGHVRPMLFLGGADTAGIEMWLCDICARNKVFDVAQFLQGAVTQMLERLDRLEKLIGKSEPGGG